MKNIFTLFSFFICTLLFAQPHDTLKKQTGYIKYAFQTQTAPLSNVYADANALLDFNDHESFYISGKLGMDSIADLGSLQSTPSTISYTQSTASEKGLIIYRNFTTKQIEYNRLKLTVFPSYKVQDNWVEMTWKIHDEFKTIAGYTTQKATTTFRGTDYTAWFSDKLPFPYGPLKLFGLEGIILEVEIHENKENNKITAYEVCYPCENTNQISAPDESITKTIEEEVRFKDNFSYYFVNEINKNEKFPVVYLSEIPTERSIRKKRENTLEKIYEWENKDTKRVLPGIDYKKLLTPGKEKENNSLPITAFPSHPTSFSRQ